MKKIIIKPQDKKINIAARAEVFLLDHIAGRGSRPSLEINIGAGARVQYVSILDPAQSHFQQERVINIAAKAEVSGYQAYFGSSQMTLKLSHNLGAQAVFHNHVLFYQTKDQNLQVQDDYIFQERGTAGRFQVEGLADDQAIVQYYSELIIKPAAQLTDSRIDMRLHLLSPGAKGNLLPGLKIDANEVKAGHGASTFQLSPEDLFYLRSRGLNEKQVKFLVIDSLARRFTADLKDRGTRELIIKLIKNRAGH
ncbi:MAG: SufD family Fe-S cluster assembly protein [Patescibacteria group bacterium]